MIPYLYSDILKLIKKLMQLIVKPDLLENCESYLDFRRIDLDDKESMTRPKDMNIGFAARSSIQELRKNGEIRNSDVAAFLSESTKFIGTILKKIFEKSPAGFSVVKNTSIFNPHALRNGKVAVVQRRLYLLLTHLEKQKIVSAAQCDKMTEQFLEFIDYDLKVLIVKFKNFSAKYTPLDNFYFRCIGIEKYKELSFLVKIVLTLSLLSSFCRVQLQP